MQTTMQMLLGTMKFASIAKVLAKCKLKYYRISECWDPRLESTADVDHQGILVASRALQETAASAEQAQEVYPKRRIRSDGAQTMDNRLGGDLLAPK